MAKVLMQTVKSMITKVSELIHPQCPNRSATLMKYNLLIKARECFVHFAEWVNVISDVTPKNKLEQFSCEKTGNCNW